MTVRRFALSAVTLGCLAFACALLVPATGPAGGAAFAAPLPSPAGAMAKSPDGKQIFLNQRCNLCHSVSTAGIDAVIKSPAMRGPDLVNVADKHDAKWLKGWLHKKIEMNGKKHRKLFTGSDAELDTLISWLQAQKK